MKLLLYSSFFYNHPSLAEGKELVHGIAAGIIKEPTTTGKKNPNKRENTQTLFLDCVV